MMCYFYWKPLPLLCSNYCLQKPDQKPEDVSPVVSLSFMEQEFTSTEAAAAPEPSWQEDFRFLVTCAGEQKLTLKV